MSRARANLAQGRAGLAQRPIVTCMRRRSLFSQLRIGVNCAVPLRVGLETSRKQGQMPAITQCAHTFP